MSQVSSTSKTEKSSPYIRHIAFINIIKKTKRTLLSVIAVMISVAIIYTSLNLFVNIYQLTKSETTASQGNYHYILLTSNTSSTNRDSVMVDDNLNLYGTLNDEIVNIRTYSLDDDASESPLGFTLVSGNKAENNNEVIVPKDAGYSIGDTISLDLAAGSFNDENLYGFSDEISSLSQSYTYKVVGLYEASDTYKEQTEGYICFYTQDNAANDLHTIYIYDKNVQYTDSIALVSSIFEVNENDIILNSNAIDYSTIRNYLQDTTTLLFMFLVIVILAFLISIISLKNVFITSDKDRKKEFGLLKSIGATKADLKYLLIVELSALGVIGAILGVILGGVVSYVVIRLFTKQLSIIITATMILNPILLPIAFIIGFLMILIIGFKQYRPYLHSNPIDDLKENTYNYDPPVKRPSYSAKSFSWKMFLIYNNRLKAQTRNIFQSFTLLIMTTVLFTAILLSNLFYQIDIGDIKYDYYFSGLTSSSLEESNATFTEALYDAVDHNEIIPSTMIVSHAIDYDGVYFERSLFDDDGISAYKSNTRVSYDETTIDNIDMSYIYMSQTLIDSHQEEELLPYYDEMENDMDLSSGGVVLILDGTSDSAYGLFKNVHVGDYVYLSSEWKEQIKGIIYYDSKDEFDTMYKTYGSFERCLYMDYNYFVENKGASLVTDYIQITLANKATASTTTVKIEQIMKDTGIQYNYTNMVETRQECKIISFILESLLYPLFVMLFIISIININNVLIGNVELKRGDISILKSVGMNSLQLYGFIAYEYAEGYINAAFVSIAIFIPLCLIENWLSLTSAFKLGENMFSTLLISLIIIDVLIVVALVALSLRSLKQIDAIENMKNIT